MTTLLADSLGKLENWPSKNYKIRVWSPPPPAVFLVLCIELELLTIIFFGRVGVNLLEFQDPLVCWKKKTLLSEVQSVKQHNQYQWGFPQKHFQWINQWLNMTTNQEQKHTFLVGGWTTHFKNYSSKWESSPSRDEHYQIFETTT